MADCNFIRSRHNQPENEAPTPIAIMIGQLTQGGSERQLYISLAHCDRSRWNPTIYVSGELGHWEGPIRDLGLPIVLLQGRQWQKFLRFRAAAKAQNAQVFLSWSSYTNAYALALIGLNVFRIGSFRNALFADLPQRGRWLWRWLSIAGVSTIVCNSVETCEQAIAYCRGRKHVVHVPNAVEIFSPETVEANRMRWRESIGVNANDILVVGVGRFEPQKNFHRFIEVIAKVAEIKKLVAVIAGAGSISETELREHAERLRAIDLIRFLGRVPDARELLCAADVFLLTSDFEGMPNVVLEAMAAGVPCVTTNVNGVRDLIVSGRTGLIVDPDVDALAAKVLALAQTPLLRQELGERARAEMIERYQASRVSKKIWAICGSGHASKKGL